jgi:hypothetical protein
MSRRVLVAALVVAGVLVSSGAAEAAQPPTSWQDALALARYPVYRPTHMLGLRERVSTGPCGLNKVSVTATYGSARSRTRPKITIFEGSPYVCGDPGEANSVKDVRIAGRTVALRVYCSHPSPCRRDTDGYHNGYLLMFFEPGHPRTMVGIESTRVHERAFLRFARSLRRVRPAAATLHLQDFLSPDRRYWCVIQRPQAFCGAHDRLARRAEVDATGAVTACVAQSPGGCLQNWEDAAPVLRAEQRVRVNGFECTPSTGAMTCTVAPGGAAAGKGFKIDATSITPVGGAPITDAGASATTAALNFVTVLSVDCSSANACVAVGTGSGANGSRARAETWNGRAWRVSRVPVPRGASGSNFYDISCASARACIAVGGYQPTRGGDDEMLVERWNGARWAIMAAPRPAGRGLADRVRDPQRTQQRVGRRLERPSLEADARPPAGGHDLQLAARAVMRLGPPVRGGGQLPGARILQVAHAGRDLGRPVVADDLEP